MADLFEHLENLSPADRQAFIDNLIYGIRGNTQKPMLVRKAIKVSSDASEEEIRKTIVEAFGLSPEQGDALEIKSELNKLQINHDIVRKFIKPYENFLIAKKATADKIDELIDLGKFLIAYDNSIEIIIPEKILSHPDFIVSKDKTTIGIEHTRLIDNKSKQFISAVKNILKRAEKQLLLKDSSLTQIINISLNYSKLMWDGKSLLNEKFSAIEKEQIAGVISNYLASVLDKNEINKPEFIEKMSISGSTNFPLSIELNEKFLGKSAFIEQLLKTINSKESKFSSYSKAGSFDEIWLLIGAGGASTASSYDFADIVSEKVNSQFDRIFLFDNFSCQIIKMLSYK